MKPKEHIRLQMVKTMGGGGETFPQGKIFDSNSRDIPEAVWNQFMIDRKKKTGDSTILVTLLPVYHVPQFEDEVEVVEEVENSGEDESDVVDAASEEEESEDMSSKKLSIKRKKK